MLDNLRYLVVLALLAVAGCMLFVVMVVVQPRLFADTCLTAVCERFGPFGVFTWNA